MFKSAVWYFNSDNDATLQSSIFKVFADLVKAERAHYFNLYLRQDTDP